MYYICFSYVPHEKSKFYELCEFDFHETIESIVLEDGDKGEVFVCGDIKDRYCNTFVTVFDQERLPSCP
jgi:hypothetical protein